jgi:hypothetical protein
MGEIAASGRFCHVSTSPQTLSVTVLTVAGETSTPSTSRSVS